MNSSELATQIQLLQAQLTSFQHALDAQSQPAQQLEPLRQTLLTLLEQLDTARDGAGKLDRFPSEQTWLPTAQTNEEYWRALSVCLPVGLFTCDRGGQCTYMNRRGQEILGCTDTEALGEGWTRCVHPDDRDRVISEWLCAAQAGLQHYTEYRVQLPQGELRWVYIRTAPALTAQGEFVGHTGTIEDVTKQKLAEDQIKASLSEKEVLLKEIHHRVKNNLQIISSLIYLQAQRIEDPEARQIFEDSQSRISSMALVHDSLYRSQNFARVHLSDYIQTLTSRLFQTYRIQSEFVNLEIDVEPDVVVSLDRAIPCGLILNELITNALKHGFTGEQQGKVRVKLHQTIEGICLIVENDGNGLPDTFELQKIQSMGLRLVNALIHQLRGKVEVEKTAKTRFKVTFNGA
jgi:PAS domain S-box-containing protein